MQSEFTDQLAVIEMLADGIFDFKSSHVESPKYFNALSAQEREGRQGLRRQARCSPRVGLGAASPPKRHRNGEREA